MMPKSLTICAGVAALAVTLPLAAEDEPLSLTAEEQAMALTAAGFHLEPDGWHGCDDPGTASWDGGRVDEVADLNGDGQPEAMISESSSYCYGAAGVGYALVSRQESGEWKLIDAGIGFPHALETRGVDNWPDLEIGGPGFCFPVLRWNGASYEPNRQEYEGRPCEPF